MKVNKNISRYVIEENGDVFERSTGEQVLMFDRTQYKLSTDEVFKSKLTKGTTNIIRRFTREQIAKLWKDKESVDLKKFESQEKRKEKIRR